MVRQLMRWELDGVRGPIVVVDVLRAFTTAAYAFGAGAKVIYLVASVDEALEFKHRHTGALAMGEEHGRRPRGFDFPNSPVAVSRSDLTDRTIVQRTSAGTQGVIAATHADRLWAASLACASATAAAVTTAQIGDPSYVITGCFADSPDTTGDDDRLTADLIERVRLGHDREVARTVAALLSTNEARRTLALDAEHSDPLDVEYASQVDVFDFAMEAVRDERGVRLERRPGAPAVTGGA